MKLFKTVVALLTLANICNAQQVSFTMNIDKGCAPLTVNFTNTSSGMGNPDSTRYEWWWNDGTSYIGFDTSHTFTYGQYFYVVLTAFNVNTNKIKGYKQQVVSVTGAGNDFTMDKDSVCPNENVYFHYADFNFQPQPTSLKWDFGDGTFNNSSGTYAVHAYTIPNVYAVKLIITTSCGVDTITQNLVVSNGVVPHVSFYHNVWESVICPGMNVQFFGYGGYLQSFYWDFGDGSTSTEMNPVHTFNQIGKYMVKFTGTNLCGNSDTFIDTLSVDTNYTFPPIVAYASSFGASPFCKADSIFFMVAAQGFFTPNFTGYQWNFGDGNVSSKEDATHVYTASGTFNCSVIVSQCNKDSTLYFPVKIKDCVSGIYESAYPVIAVNIYPNPFSSSATIEMNAESIMDNTELRLFNVLGQEVVQTPIVSQSTQLDRGNLPDGMYFYEVRNDKNLIGKGKLIIQ